MAAVEQAIPDKEWFSKDLRATVERELEALKQEGWVVVEKIDKGRFRRSHGLRAVWERTPWAKERENLQQHGGPTVRTEQENEQLEESERRDCFRESRAVNGSMSRSMIDQLPMAVVVVNAPIIGALTTCHPRRCYSPSPKRGRGRGCTSCSVTNCRQLRFPNQDVVSKQPETDRPTSDGRFRAFRMSDRLNVSGPQPGRAPAEGISRRLFELARAPFHIPCRRRSNQT